MIAGSNKYCIFAVATILSFLTFSCNESIWEQDKYQPPEWQEGKIFTQIQKEDDLKTFTSLLEATGYDTILNTSGSYTVFAPTDAAFESFFQEYPEYQSLLDSTTSSWKLTALIEFQIIYNAWSKDQFQSLDVGGWIDPIDKFSEPRAFKRKTIFREENKKYYTIRTGNYYQIVNAPESSIYRIAFSRSNKYCPIFFDDFFEVHNLTYEDYEFYFNRTFNSEKLYFAGAEFDQRIPAENGFIYKSDKVVIPLLNAEEILEQEYSTGTYHDFLDLIHQFASFNINLEATYDQPGAEQGLAVDSLYNLSYPDLVFNIHNELTGNTSNSSNTLREHFGLLAPNDQALQEFLDEYLSIWGDLEDLPVTIKKIIINSHMSPAPVYSSDLGPGFLNGEEDRVFLNESEIDQKIFGSNCTFLGLNEAIVPRAITSVCRPVYLTRNYQIMMRAIESTNVLAALKKTNANYSFFLPSDVGIGMGGDSSLSVVIDNKLLDRYHFQGFDKGEDRFFRVNTNYLRKKIFNQIGTDVPKGIANKEFIENLGGNYIVFDHSTGIVKGTAPTTFGINGDSVVDLYPEEYNNYTDNGVVYDVNTWFSFAKSDYYAVFISKFPWFLDLLSKAGLFDPRYYDFPFLLDGMPYTIFVPTREALEEYRADTLSKVELQEFLKYHFIKSELIFTDGRHPSAKYPTLRIDESSTSIITKPSMLSIRTKPDILEILDGEDNVYVEIPEEDGITNIIVAYDNDKTSTSEWDYTTTAVIHTIDKVLVKDSLYAR